jgi:hypothetical protein
MSGGLAFRKDCEDCGHSFLTHDRKAKSCPRCAGKGRKMEQPEEIRAKGHSSKTSVTTKPTNSERSPSTPTPKPGPRDSRKVEPPENQSVPFKPKASEEENRKTFADQKPHLENQEILLTEKHTQEIIKRYQAYVEVMERPPRGRRKTIAAEMVLPYRAVVIALHNWNQAQQKDLSREDRFAVEKAYFSFLEKENSFDQLKDSICRETGLNPWSVSRYLDILHDGGDELKEIPDVSPEQRTAILAEYNNYLTGSAPPGPFLHPMIGEKIGVKTKQVHKVLLAYRLGRLRERWS